MDREFMTCATAMKTSAWHTSEAFAGEYGERFFAVDDDQVQVDVGELVEQHAPASEHSS
jgi:hypothetical protein